MRKHFFFANCIIVALFIITSCGKQEVKKNEAMIEEKAVVIIETPIQKEEIEEVEEVPEEVVEEVTEEIEVDILIPSAEKYWNLNRFYLYDFLNDCGAESITEETDNLGPEISYIEAKFGSWYIDIYTDNYEQYANIYVWNEDPSISGFYKDIDYEDFKSTIIISVDDKGTMVHQITIDSLEELIKAIRISNSKGEERPIIDGYIY